MKIWNNCTASNKIQIARNAVAMLSLLSSELSSSGAHFEKNGDSLKKERDAAAANCSDKAGLHCEPFHSTTTDRRASERLREPLERSHATWGCILISSLILFFDLTAGFQINLATTI